MKLTPSSVARRRTASAEAGSLGGPQIPSPVIRMAPKPRRRTVSSPPNETVPLEAASGLAILSFIFVPPKYSFCDMTLSVIRSLFQLVVMTILVEASAMPTRLRRMSAYSPCFFQLLLRVQVAPSGGDVDSSHRRRFIGSGAMDISVSQNSPGTPRC